MKLFKTTDGRLINPNLVMTAKCFKIENLWVVEWNFGNFLVNFGFNSREAATAELKRFEDHFNKVSTFPVL